MNKLKTMLLRILILVFAFNASISSAYAVQDMSDCKNMGANSMLMSASVADDMDCEMAEEMDCNMLQCVSDCTTSSGPLLLPEESFSFITAGRTQFHHGLVLFYSIIHPINTPPPLV